MFAEGYEAAIDGEVSRQRAEERPPLVKGQPASEDHWTRTAAGYALVQWIGHLAHNEGTIPMDVAVEIRAAVAAIEAEAAGMEP